MYCMLMLIMSMLINIFLSGYNQNFMILYSVSIASKFWPLVHALKLVLVYNGNMLFWILLSLICLIWDTFT